jgi:hypothetical protein
MHGLFVAAPEGQQLLVLMMVGVTAKGLTTLFFFLPLTTGALRTAATVGHIGVLVVSAHEGQALVPHSASIIIINRQQ